MDEKMRELIAIGASVSAHCQPCVTFHVAKARELGIGDELIQEAVAVGQMVERGAGAAMREFVKQLSENPATAAGCCCGNGTGATTSGGAGSRCG